MRAAERVRPYGHHTARMALRSKRRVPVGGSPRHQRLDFARPGRGTSPPPLQSAMKVAFHFDETRLNGGDEVIKAVLRSLRIANKFAQTKVFIGTLLFDHAASERSQHGTVTVERVNMRLREGLIR